VFSPSDSVQLFPSLLHPFNTLTSVAVPTHTMLARMRMPRLPFSSLRTYATVSSPQTRIEKIVQKYAVDLASPSTKVRAGDYVMIRPEHV